MQILLPIYPVGTEMISASLGVGKKDGIVTCLHSGMQIYSHPESDYRSFRFITSKFILQGLCRMVDISGCFHVSYDSVKRYVKRLENCGDKGFFTDDKRNGGSCHKILPDVAQRMQRYLDDGKSNCEIARLENVTEGAIRYAIKNGYLKKKTSQDQSSQGSNRTERSIADAQTPLGIGTTRTDDRVAASLGLLSEATPVFENANNVCNAGVLFILPALLSQGLLKVSTILSPLRSGYYGLMSILLTLAFMLLSRIKCPEQLKTCKVGELGKLIGLDRMPEARCLRNKIAQIVDQEKADDLSKALLHEWMDKDEHAFFYMDGHVRVYHGHLAKRPKRFVSREKLCLSGTTDFWVNNEFGMPYMVVTGELNEKLKDILFEQIVPALLTEHAGDIVEQQLKDDPDRARFTMVFDREAYDLGFFKKLWDTHRIAVLTYRKAVKDQWPATDFTQIETAVIGKSTTMNLCEKTWNHDKCTMREIRKLSENGHQTSIITTMRQATSAFLAGKMFSRWSQENFFRYMVQDYDMDKLVQYGVEEVNPESDIVNPSYRSIKSRIKKMQEKSRRLKAKMFSKIEDNLIADIDLVKQVLEQQAQLQDEIADNELDLQKERTELEKTPQYIKVKDMPKEERYTRLKTESKQFMNTMRMIVYRAETAIANILSPHYARSTEEIRMLVKEIIKSDADLIPDQENKILTVRLHSLSTPRANSAAKELCTILNDTESLFPGTDLRLFYKTV